MRTIAVALLALGLASACGGSYGGGSPGDGYGTSAPAGTKAPLATPAAATPTAGPMRTDDYDMGYGY